MNLANKVTLEKKEKGSGKTILIVDDDHNFLEAISLIVKNCRHNVILAYDGCEAVSLYKKFHPNLVLSDVKMPKMDGCMAFHEIREYDPKAKIIFMTGFGINECVIEASQLGLLETIDKPFGVKRIMKILSNHLDNVS